MTLKMKKILFFTIVFLLCASLAAAVTVETNKDEYSGSETVQITVSDCLGVSIVKILNPNGMLADIKSGSGNWATSYNALSDSADGKYQVTVSCSNGNAKNFFCVDEPGCLGAAVVISGEEEGEGETVSSGGGGGGGGGGGLCTSQWDCSVWTKCGTNLQQNRSCIDTKGCSPKKYENRSCTPCYESWICTAWSECYLGKNTRMCYDERNCGTEDFKPAREKSCQAASVAGPQPKQITYQIPPPSYGQQAVAAPKESSIQKFWEQYRLHIIAGVAALVLLTIATLLLFRFIKARKSEAYNLNELKDWVRKEKEMGSSEENMRSILKKSTTWREEEINRVFQELQAKPSSRPALQKPTASGA